MPSCTTIIFFSVMWWQAFSKLISQSVQCDPSQMHVFFDFDEDFRGIIYSKEFFNKPGCQIYGDGSRKASITFPLNIDASREPFCGVRLQPSKHIFDVVLRVNSDTTILVDGMKEFQVKCEYRLDAVTLQLPSLGGLRIEEGPAGSSAQEDPVPQAIIQGSGSGIVPILDMIMRRGAGIFGQPVQTAAIGEEITMDVYLHDKVPYDIFVYNCIAHEGSRLPGGTVTLIDSNGCGMALDRVTIPPVEVTVDEDGIKHVHLRLRGFQFSTSETVYFECQVKPCLHQCNQTQCPPIRPSATTPEFSETPQTLPQLDAAPSLSLQAALAMRFEDPEKLAQGAPSLLRLNGETQKAEVCLASGLMAVLATIFVAVCLLCAGTMSFLCHRLRGEKEFPVDSSQTSTLYRDSLSSSLH